MSRSLAFSLTLFLLLSAGAFPVERAPSGAIETRQALDRLSTVGSVLMIAAHPDDENTSVLAYFARGRHLRTAYLSLTRGEGGQNLIGSEQGDRLGVIRTQELLSARRIDGAQQFFTRAIDFGFSKTASETLAKWGREEVLGDIVLAIRRFQPDVIVLRFSGTPRDGHGQHQSSAILAKEAFAAAADPARFPEQLSIVRPWKARRLLFNIFAFTPEQERAAAETPGKIELDTGEYSALLGRSYDEIAGISRSQHRSQAMGWAERRGSSRQYLVLVDGEPAAKDALEGVDITWNRVPGGKAVADALAEASRAYDPTAPEKSIPAILKARALAAKLSDPAAAAKLPEFDEAVALCAGIWLDAASDKFLVSPGGMVRVNLTALVRSRVPAELLSAEIPGGVSEETAGSAALAFNQPLRRRITWRAPAGRAYSQPFWLSRPKRGTLYGTADRTILNDPDSAPELKARFQLRAGGESITIERPVQYRFVDQLEGELTRSLIIAPPVAVNLTENVVMFPDRAARKFTVQLVANEAGVSGDLKLALPDGWKADPASRPFKIAASGEQVALAFEITPPASASTGTVRAVAVAGGQEISSGQETIRYPHIPIQTLFPPAEAKLVRADIRTLARKIGYVMGAGDEVPQSLRQLGATVTLLGAEDLSSRDLAEFDAIVVGVRGFSVRPDLRAQKARLMDYAANGGVVVVQYHVAEGMFGAREVVSLNNIGPYPFRIGRDRVTVEEAPITTRLKDHLLLTAPNRISEADFEGWVQERGLYFASDWDTHYEAPIECNDPGEKPLAGGILYAQTGRGAYIYTTYSWFRQLPAGVPGAYRLFANMLSAVKTTEGR